MATFDSLLWLFALAALSPMGLKDPPGWTRWLPLVLGILLIAHLFVEGARWQMVPAYVALAFVFAIPGQRRSIRVCAASFSLLLLVGSGALSWAFPVFDLPQPDGPYAIGTTKVEFVDKGRDESYSDVPDDPRRLMLRVWYPAEAASGSTAARYWEEPVIRSRAVTQGTPLPWFTFTHLGRVKTFSHWEANIANGRFPVVLYSSGLGIGWSSSNTPMAEQLASHGYIVVGIDHTFLGSATIFPDQVVTFDEATRVALNTSPPEEILALYRKVNDSTDIKEQLDLYMQGMALMPASIMIPVDTALQIQVEDQKAVLNSLQTLIVKDVALVEHMDLSNVGLVGMSLGGSAAIITCGNDPLCKAVVNLDGFHPGQAPVHLSVPLMVMHRPQNLLALENFESSNALAYDLRIEETTHFNFFDFSMMSPLYARLGILGAIDGDRMVDILCRYTLAFFNEALKGEESSLLKPDGQPDAPAVRLRSSDRPQALNPEIWRGCCRN